MGEKLSNLSWDDLRVVKAIGDTRTLAAAAVALGLNNSTMSRRLAQIEDTLGVALFDRWRSGYSATFAGAEVIALAERVELDIVGVAKRVSGREHAHAGDLRLTTSDSLLLHFLTPIIADFKAHNPLVRVEVIVGNSALNLARGESDIAIRATEAPPENLFGRKCATIGWALYGRRSDLAKPEAARRSEQQWVSYGGALAALKASKHVDAEVPQKNITYRSDSVAAVAVAITAGLGVGYLPCMLGDLVPELARMGPVDKDLSDQLWILTHPDIRKSGRVYAFMSHCAEAIAKRRALIEGRQDERSPS